MEFCLSPRESEAFTTDHPQPILEIFRILSQLSEKSELAPFSGPEAEGLTSQNTRDRDQSVSK